MLHDWLASLSHNLWQCGVTVKGDKGWEPGSNVDRKSMGGRRRDTGYPSGQDQREIRTKFCNIAQISQ